MKENKKWYKKILPAVILFLAATKTKVYGEIPISDDFSRIESVYGVPEPDIDVTDWIEIIIKIITSPLIFLIGLIIFWKKSKLKQKIKIYITILVLIIAAIIFYWVMNNFK